MNTAKQNKLGGTIAGEPPKNCALGRSACYVTLLFGTCCAYCAVIQVDTLRA